MSVDAVIPNAATEDLLAPEYPRELADDLGISDNTTAITYAGSFNEWKNDIELVLKTTGELSWNDYTVMIIAGDEDRIVKLDEFTTDLGIEQDLIDSHTI